MTTHSQLPATSLQTRGQQKSQPVVNSPHRQCVKVNNQPMTPAPAPAFRHSATRKGSTTPYARATARVYWRDQLGVDHSSVPGKALLNDEIYLAQQARTGNRYPKKRNYQGLHWFSNTQMHVWYESLFERHALLWLDFTCDIVAISTQPMRMVFEDGTEHYPDFIALHADHRQTVYDVKPASLIGPEAQEQFDKTAQFCRRAGWGYEVLSEFDPVVRSNIEWLSQFRQNCFAPTPEVRARLFEALSEPLNVGDAAYAMHQGTWTGGVGAIYHLVWNRELVLDLTSPLSNNTLIGKAIHHAHA